MFFAGFQCQPAQHVIEPRETIALRKSTLSTVWEALFTDQSRSQYGAYHHDPVRLSMSAHWEGDKGL